MTNAPLMHKTLMAGRWPTMSLVEKLANVGSEVERALSWQAKNQTTYSYRAFCRALELLDITRTTTGLPVSQQRELGRLREVLVDYFVGPNQYGSTPVLWQHYFRPFVLAARRQI